MSSSPDRWADRLWHSMLIVLATAAGLFLAWQLIRPLLPLLIVAVALVGIVRLAVGSVRRRREW